jgi:hypothetical protein
MTARIADEMQLVFDDAFELRTGGSAEPPGRP